jgi:hypothetical protein
VSHHYAVSPRSSLQLEPDDVVVVVGYARPSGKPVWRPALQRFETPRLGRMVELARFSARELLARIGDAAAVAGFGFTTGAAAVTSSTTTTARVDVYRAGRACFRALSTLVEVADV